MLRQLRWIGVLLSGPLFLVVNFTLLDLGSQALRWLVLPASLVLVVGMALHSAYQQRRLRRGLPINANVSWFWSGTSVAYVLVAMLGLRLFTTEMWLLVGFVLLLAYGLQGQVATIALTWQSSQMAMIWHALGWQDPIPRYARRILRILLFLIILGGSTIITVIVGVWQSLFPGSKIPWLVGVTPGTLPVAHSGLILLTLVAGWLLSLLIGNTLSQLHTPYRRRYVRVRLLILVLLFGVLHIPLVLVGQPQVFLLTVFAAAGLTGVGYNTARQYRLTRMQLDDTTAVRQQLTRFEPAIPRLPAAKPATAMQACYYLYSLYRGLDRPAAAYRAAEFAFDYAEATGNVLFQGEVLSMMADLNIPEKPQLAINQYNHALDLFRHRGHWMERLYWLLGVSMDFQQEAVFLYGIADTHAKHGRPQEALDTLVEMDAVFKDRQRVYPVGMWRHVTAGEAHLALGQIDEARAALARAEDYRRTIDTRGLTARELQEKDEQLVALKQALAEAS